MSRFAYAFALFLTLVVCATTGPARAQTTIIAVVNGQPITSYDLTQRQNLLKLTGGKGNLRSAALEELINEQLQMYAASASKITVSDGEVGEAVASLATRVKLSPAQLEQALSQSGTSIGSLKDRLRAQLAFARLIRTRFSGSLEVSEPDLVAALLKDNDLEKQIDTAEYDLQQVIVAMPKDPSPSRIATGKTLAASVRSKFRSCSAGLEMAKSTRNVVVRTYGRRTENELPKPIADAVKDVPVGGLSEPVDLPQGLVMFAVCDKKQLRSTNAAMKALEPDMANERGEAFVKQYLRQLRRDAVIDIR